MDENPKKLTINETLKRAKDEVNSWPEYKQRMARNQPFTNLPAKRPYERNLCYLETDEKQVTVDAVDDSGYLEVALAGFPSVKVPITKEEAKHLAEAFTIFSLS